MRKSIAIKVKSFPNVSETFVVSNIVFALKNKFKVRVFVAKYRGVNNSSQADTLQQYNLEEKIEKPFSFSKYQVVRWCQLAFMALHPRVLTYLFKYYKNKSKRNIKPLLELYQYRHFKKNAVCHVHFNNALHPLQKLAKIGYIDPKVIVSFHGFDAFLENKESFQKAYGAFYRKYVKAVTVNSQYLKQQLLTLGIDENLIHIIPIGIDILDFKGTEKKIIPKHPIKLITIGRLVQLKGHTYAINCVRKLRDAGYLVQYTIWGAGESLDKLQKQVAELDLKETVYFKGKASQEDVKHTLNESHIFLMPSTYDEITGRREAFGLVSIEAQAMGLPVIGFNSGGFPDTLKSGVTGFTVTDRNITEMAEKVQYLIDNPKVYTAMSQAAIEHAASFDHQYTTQHYIDLYEENL
ncbi:glycosyltransferase family 4 protein [uncultured Marixanthomonas sp.]|jgi:colanic acid/amylovoran biosynthesis glycosyltransferase|uniref:glycosyltransferase family 4 protein n=1 Tax=uncultured Marixanthomonas sp. TaxID=757245 RepID=UPI0030DCF297|tara:strand:- start:55513 stop:56736 length:1224 start_codon:yes stop_codon:yes gene_type:complete